MSDSELSDSELSDSELSDSEMSDSEISDSEKSYWDLNVGGGNIYVDVKNWNGNIYFFLH